MKKEIKPLSGGPYGMKIILLAGKPNTGLSLIHI